MNLAVERALVLLRYIMVNEEGLSIREVSRDMGFNPATVQKIINSLSAQGFIVQDEVTTRYHLGPEAVQLGLIALDRLDVRRVARPYLENLSARTGETVFLAIARGKHTVYVDKIVSNQPIRMDAPLGVDRPYNCTAVGKTFLSGMSNQEVETLHAEDAFEKRTKQTIIDIDALLDEVERIRENGWAIDDEEFSLGVMCLSVPVFNHLDKVVAAVTVSGPKSRIEKNKEAYLQLLQENVAEISQSLGYKIAQKV